MPKKVMMTFPLLWDAFAHAVKNTTAHWNGNLLNEDPPMAALEVEASVQEFLETHPLTTTDEPCWARGMNRESRMVSCGRPKRHKGMHQHWNRQTGEFVEWFIRGVLPHQAGDWERPIQ